MAGTLLGIALGVLVVLLITVATGWFVAQEFAYTTVDRARLRALAKDGDAGARRALQITGRTSFMLSGAQLGITVTGLLVGYAAEPLIGDGVAELLGLSGVPEGVGLVVGATGALLLATIVQMVFGELFPKNLAIARPEASALRLAGSTGLYLALFGWLIALFDRASELLLRALRIEPVHHLEHSATPRDLEAIIDESRDAGVLEPELSVLLDRVLDFGGRTAREAMVPRARVAAVAVDLPAHALPAVMTSGHSRLPVLGPDPQDPDAGPETVVGVVCLRDLLKRDDLHDVMAPDGGHDPAGGPDPTGRPAPAGITVADLARPPVLVPESLRLQAVLQVLRESGEELACVLDEYGGWAGVITLEDVAEELLGEITDEHDPTVVVTERNGHGWTVPAELHLDEAERLVDVPLPRGGWDTVGGLVTGLLQRLPEVGDEIRVPAPANPGADEPPPPRELHLTVLAVRRRVPAQVHVQIHERADDVGTDAPAGTSSGRVDA